MPQWPPRIPRAGGGPTPPGGADIRAPKVIVGSASAGDTIDVCDILDPGDGTGIEAALASVNSNGGDIWLRPGRYNLGQPTSPTLPMVLPGGVTIRGSGSQPSIAAFGPGVSAAILVVGDSRQVFSIQDFADFIDVFFEVAPVDGETTGTSLIAPATLQEFNALRLTRVTVFLPFVPDTRDTLEWLFFAVQLRSVSTQVISEYANGEAGGVAMGAFLASELYSTSDWVFGLDNGAFATQGSMTGADIRVALNALALQDGSFRIAACSLATESDASTSVVDARSNVAVEISASDIRGEAGGGAIVDGVRVGQNCEVNIVGNRIQNCVNGVAIVDPFATVTVGFNNLRNNGFGVSNASVLSEIAHNILPGNN